MKAEDVQSGEVDREAERRFAVVVGDGLWVEGGAPVGVL